VLAPNLFAIDMDVKDSTGSFDQLRIHAELLFDLRRQTGGARQIISLRAEFDRNRHAIFS
jgi:hypothetical protein